MTDAAEISPIALIWQAALALVGLTVVIRQARALRKTPARNVVPAWEATPPQILAFAGIAVLCMVCVPMFCASAAHAFFPEVDFQNHLLFLVPATQTLTLVVLLASIKLFPEAFPKTFNAEPEARSRDWLSPKNLFGVPALFATGFFLAFAAMLVIANVLPLLPENVQALFQENQRLVNEISASENWIFPALCVPAIAIFTPIIEELIFRAGLYRFLKSKMSAVPAALLSSIIFALLHDAPNSYLPLTLLGCVFCLAYEKTGRIAAPILIHALFNANTLLCLVLA